MNNNPHLISIIIPVYNTEKYLDQCIQSVLAQTYTNWELLLIDDGSTDSSGVICDKYAAEDSRINVVHKPNTGVSDSKNMALDMVQGEYIMFLDSDDYWCSNDCIAQLYAKSQELGVDIVRGEYKAVDESGNLLFERALNATKQQAVNKLLPPYQFLTEVIQGEFFLVLSLFRKKLFDHIRFNPAMVFQEDIEIYLKILANNNQLKAIYLHNRFYAYRKHLGATSASPYNIQHYLNSLALCDIYNQLSKETENIMISIFYKKESVLKYYRTIASLAKSTNGNTSSSIMQRIDIIGAYKKAIKRMMRYAIFTKFSLFVLLPPFVSIKLIYWGTILKHKL